MRVPKLCRNSDGRAFVTIPKTTKRIYFGMYGSARAAEEYGVFLKRLAEVETANKLEQAKIDALLALPKGPQTVQELSLAYLVYAEDFFAVKYKPGDWPERKRLPKHASRSENGTVSVPTTDFHNTRKTIEHLLKVMEKLAADGHSEWAAEFGPAKLVAFQKHLIKAGYCRRIVNRGVNRIRRMFRWGCQNELLPPEHFHKLMCVESLKRGKTDAPESEDVKPVPLEHVLALKPFVPPVIHDMNLVQYLGGMRPGEVCIIRECDMKMSLPIWLFKPFKHKGQWLGEELIKAIPKTAQEILAKYFREDPEEYLFQPADAIEWRQQNRELLRTKQRTYPVYPSELRARKRIKKQREKKQKSSRRIRDCYDTDSYRGAIEYGFKRAKKAGVEIPHWHPHQLRHSIGTEVRQTIGQEAAQIFLGHAHIQTTEGYTEKEIKELIAVAEAMDRHWGQRRIS